MSFEIASLLILLLPWISNGQIRTVAMTVDDLPFAAAASSPLRVSDAQQAADVNQTILRAFARHHIPATGFVNEQRAEQLGIAMSQNILMQWINPVLIWAIICTPIPM